jgi:putative tryptophan/tyrosine transport system substrate-binding protein
MRRRDFITLLGAVTWPLAADAQQAARLPTIGYLGAGSEAGWSTWTAAFVQRMRELGWIEGRTVAIEYRWAEGRSERFAEISSEFVDLKVDVIVTVGSAVAAAMRATSTIPIVSELQWTRSAPAWSLRWRDLVATSPVYQFRRPSFRASESSCCVN